MSDTKIQSSPCHLPLKDAIPGFAKAVEGMRLKEKRKIFIHPDLAYGKTGCVPPNSLLIAEVEVLTFE